MNDVAVILLRSPVRDVAPVPIAQPGPALGEATLTLGHGRTGPIVPQTGPDAPDPGAPSSDTRGAAQTVVVTWGGETYGRDCGEGLPDVSERVDAHRPVLAATGPVAPFAEQRVRVRREGRVRRCVIGNWHPARATFKVRWWREGKPRTEGDRIVAGERTLLPGGGKTRRVTKGKVGCSVTATTAGGWATEDSYNQR